KPVIYQKVNGQRKEVDGSYVIRGRHEVGFKIGAYDPSQPLVIDPSIAYFTAVAAYGQVYGIKVDANGYAYITGTCEPPSGLISTQGPLPAEDFDETSFYSFVAKLTPAGNALVY